MNLFCTVCCEPLPLRRVKLKQSTCSGGCQAEKGKTRQDALRQAQRVSYAAQRYSRDGSQRVSVLMSMVAIFGCGLCKAEKIHGRFRGNDQHEPEMICAKCGSKSIWRFVRYEHLDRGSDPYTEPSVRG